MERGRWGVAGSVELSNFRVSVVHRPPKPSLPSSPTSSRCRSMSHSRCRSNGSTHGSAASLKNAINESCVAEKGKFPANTLGRPSSGGAPVVVGTVVAAESSAISGKGRLLLEEGGWVVGRGKGKTEREGQRQREGNELAVELAVELRPEIHVLTELEE